MTQPGHRPVAVVTGASAGVGRATVRALAADGYDVACLARGAAGLAGAVADAEAWGARALAVEVDVAHWEEVRDAAARVEAELGPIDVWINNAMTTVFGWVHDLAAAEVRRATEVTYLGQVHGTLAALEYFRPRDRGTIVSVGSALAYRAIPLQAPYCAAKFATRGFMEALRTELLAEGSGVRIAQVHLPALDTPQFGWCRSHLPLHPQPVPPIHPPELAARAIVAAARRPTRSTVVGGWNRMIVLVNKVAPGILDHYAARTAVEGQQTTAHHRGAENNLEVPLDVTVDRGARGVFGEVAEGVRSPSFLRSLPGVVFDAAASVLARSREVVGSRGRRVMRRSR